MAYQALYREWRPQSFAEVVGQEYIRRILQNSLQAKRIAHAYLFCGPRGTGKTSMAKIFAKAINCVHGPASEPCNQCYPCQQITAGAFLDVFEIDGASNRGIDEVRELRDKLQLAPAEGRYKVYIIDEVHMLTTEAFNALLKTLEEPPAHVVFIFATTEAHKIPLTILSRCQRFDFQRLSTKVIATHLANVAAKLKVEIEAKTLRLLARKAEGSLRDALSLLDQCIALDGAIQYEDVLAVLGVTTEETLADMVDALAAKEIVILIRNLNQLLDKGHDPRQLVKELITYFRNLLMVKVAPDTSELVEVTEEQGQVLMRQASYFAVDRILAMIELLAQTEKEVRWSSQPRIVLEVMAIRLLQALAAEALAPVSPGEIKENAAAPAAPAIVDNVPRQNKVAASKKTTSTSQQKPVKKITLEKLQQCWPQVVAELREFNLPVALLVQEGKLVALEHDVLTLAFAYAVHKEKVAEKYREQIEAVLKKIVRQELKVRCVLVEDEKEEPEQKEQSSLLQAAINIFGPERVKEVGKQGR
jgi:DNA polymerase-3 subunit gamma/tau